ncbi:MAG: hypothetical protein JNK87_16825 [Bryobacterales bacterium]|nr:hypothetical protein [Bryobacterales bacterium]
MKTTTIIVTAALLSAGTLAAETLASGIAFQTPSGWTATVVGDAAALVPPNASAQNELYGIAPLAGVKDSNDPQLPAVLAKNFEGEGVTAQSVGQPVVFQAAGGAGKVFGYDVNKNGERGRMLFFVVSLPGNRAALLVAAGTPQLLAARQSALAEAATSIHLQAGAKAAPAVGAPAAGTPLVRQWMARLTDKKLVYMSSYNSGGGGGGYSSEKKLFLSADGSYAFRAASSVSVYVPGATGGSAGRDAQDGRWRVVEQGGQALLELTASNGTKEMIQLSADGTRTFLNGKRWFVVGINE